MAIDTNLVTALGAGSGVDTKSLAKSLVDVERQPRADAIQAKIDRTEAKISGYSAAMAVLNVFKTAFEGFSTASAFNSLSVSNSQTSALSVTTSASASTGRHQVEVTSLARAQVSEFTWVDTDLETRYGFDDLDDPINGGNAFDMTLTVGVSPTTTTETISIAADQTTPEGIVEAINTANKGITARIVDTGADSDRYKIVITGEIGYNSKFSLADSSGKLATPATDLQAASDARLVVDGVTFTRTSNVLDDVITGAVLKISATNAGSPAMLEFSRDTAALKEKAKTLVAAYNDTISDFKILSGPKSDDPEDIFSGSLQNDSTVRFLTSKVREMITYTAETGGDNVSSLTDLGFSFDRSGVLSFDEGTFDGKVSAHFDEVVSALSGIDTTNGSVVRGVAATAVLGLNSLMSSTGVIVSQSKGAETTVKRYQADLEKLEERMNSLLSRYQKQFAVMESLVGNITSMRESLKGQFESLAAIYNNK
jgi:flagellar hook-associated protein 2